MRQTTRQLPFASDDGFCFFDTDETLNVGGGGAGRLNGFCRLGGGRGVAAVSFDVVVVVVVVSA